MYSRKHCWSVSLIILLIIGITLWRVVGVAAEEDEDQNGLAGQLSGIDVIQQEIDKIDETIKVITVVKSDRVAEEFGVGVEDIAQRLYDLGLLKSSFERLRNAIVALEKIEKDKQAVKDRYESFRAKGMTQMPPYTLSFLDALQEELSTAERNQQNIGLTIELHRREIGEHSERLKTLEKELRRRKAELEETRQADKVLRWKIDEETIQMRYLETIIQAKQKEIRRHELEHDLTSLQIALLKEQADTIKLQVAYDDEDLERQLAAIQKKKDALEKENQRLREEQKTIERKWLQAQRDLSQAQGGEQQSAAEAHLKGRYEWRQTYQLALELNERAALLLDSQRLAWQKRYGLVKGETSPDQLKMMRAEAERAIQSMGQTLQIQQNYLANLQKQISSIESRLAGEAPPAIHRHLSVQTDALRKQLERRLEYQSIILDTDQIEKRLLGDIENIMGRITIQDHITDIKEDIVDFWNIEIWTVDNQSVTLRKVAVALVILSIGMIAAKFILAMIRTRFLLKSQLKETTASAVHKILSYAAYLLVVLFALRMVNIPLTAFAFLGGAVAIGIGFGAQNLINNFISGFMILGERPINIGDLIEVDGVVGMVEEIGTRCTRVRTGENIHILVPNSTFLEKNIINWTLADKKIRTQISVGVAYGSSVDQVRAKLIEAANQVPRVLKHPEPFVTFSDFGDNALLFNIYFWVGIQRVIERRQIESDVRFMIDALLAQENIVIAFPQRDVHLDASRPLRIELTEKGIN